MARRNRRHRKSKSHGPSPKARSGLSVKTVSVGVAVSAVVLGLVFGYVWRPSTGGGETQGGTQFANLPPLSTKGTSLHGWHDMAHMPKRSKGRALPVGEPQPDVMVEPANINLGNVGRRDIVSLNYVVVNKGAQELVVNHMVTSCGCTTARLSHNIIPPGHRADLEVRFDAGYHKVNPGGRVVRVVWLETNDPDTPVAEARLTATIM